MKTAYNLHFNSLVSVAHRKCLNHLYVCMYVCMYVGRYVCVLEFRRAGEKLEVHMPAEDQPGQFFIKPLRLTLYSEFGWSRPNSFTVACMGLCFMFVTKMSQIHLLLNSAYTASSPLLFLTLPLQQVVMGCAKSLKGTQLGHLNPVDQRDILYSMTCSEIKAGGGRTKWCSEFLPN